MNYDFHAQYALPSRDRETQSVAVDFLTGCVDKPPDKWPELARLEDPAARLEVLAQATVSPLKNRARTGELRGKSGGLWHWLTSRQAQGFLESRMAVFRGLGLLPSLPDLTAFPTGTWGIQLSFKLITPYISLDDTEWHILDNPVKKEKLFKLPCVTPSQWKGALRAAIRRENGWEDDHLNLLRIFGQSRDDEGRKGRIILYPTFFTRIGLEVINPHSRSSGAGKQPIYFECVPAGASGELVMLYVPVDRIGRDETETRDQVAQDLQWIADGTRAMLTVYGFGAKTSSGYGVAEDRLPEAGRLCAQRKLSFKNDKSSPNHPSRKAQHYTFSSWDELTRTIKDAKHDLQIKRL